MSIGVLTGLTPGSPFESSAAANTACGTSCDNISSDRVVLAQQLVAYKNAGKFEASSSSSNDIFNTQIAPVALNAPLAGCEVDTRVLQTMVIVVKKFGSLRVNDLNRACPSMFHYYSCLDFPQSTHCLTPSLAIDFGRVGGNATLGSGAQTLSLLNFLDTFVPSGTQAGQSTCGNRSWTFTNMSQFSDECTHQHVNFRPAGQLRIDTVSPASILHQTGVVGSSWSNMSTGVDLGAASATSVVNMGGSTPQVMANAGGYLHQVYANSAGWQDASTGLLIGAGSRISSVNVGGSWPQTVVNTGGYLHLAYGTSAGWQFSNSGLSIGTGPLSAVVVDGKIQVFVNINSVLHVATQGASGWQLNSTGKDLGSPTAPISAVYVSGSWPQVFANYGGTLLQIYGNSAGWQVGNTGVQVGAGTSISTVLVAGQSAPQVFTNTGAFMHQIYATTSGWVLSNSGTRIGDSPISAVNMGGALQIWNLQ
jgi:hypothetical protein